MRFEIIITKRHRQAAFTLLELLVALAILVTALTIALSTFHSITRAWQRGTAMADSLNRGELVMEQLAVGLRSAFFPTSATNRSERITGYGFWLEDNGDGVYARDSFSWVKKGPEMLPPGTNLHDGLHRILLSVEDDSDGEPALAVRTWLPYAVDSFDPSVLEPFLIATKVVGLDCRVATNQVDNDGWEWISSWEDRLTNTLPLAVEVTLYLKSLEPNEPPIELQRVIEVPAAPLSQLSIRGLP